MVEKFGTACVAILASCFAVTYGCYKFPPDARDPCQGKHCPFGSRCRPSLDGRTAECVCPEKCATYGDSRGSRPVCGTDGRDYPNVCELRRSSCKEMRDIQIKYQGRCDPCEGVECPTSQVCQLDEGRNPLCRCSAICSPELRPVCGSDGKTYTNECNLRVEACRSRKIIRIIYTGECSAGANPCEGLNCGPGEECDIDRFGIATCKCPPSCEPVMRPVCGSDGRTYHNDCELIRQACLSKREVTLTYRGECGERGPCHNHECTFGAVCVIKAGYAVCECPRCNEEFQPVCGTDGISYTNLCKLKREGCEQKTHIDVAYEGLCNGCENKNCEFYAVCESDGKNEAKCVCPHSCIKVESTVCGTDGVTYLNECEMRVAACNKQQHVVVGSRGPCDLCQNVHCKHGARCENGRCICPTNCPDHFEPVCATDGITYPNECEMMKATCVHNQDLNVLFYGECGEVGSSGQELRSVGEGCREKLCRLGARCEYDAEGLPMCVCNFDCPETRKPVCGSDGKIHPNDCRLKELSCKHQIQLYILPMSMCEADDSDIPCDGEIPLVDPLTGKDYYCGEGPDAKRCPPSSYCHRTISTAKCCREMALIKTCADSTFGCCPDGETSALGPEFAGCPSLCNCNRLGSYGLTCDAETSQCNCKPGVGGLKCDRCEPGFWGLHKATEGGSGCLTCNCNLMGSVRDDCEQMTGRCVCKQGVQGLKCDICPEGTVLGPDGCSDVTIAKPITGSCKDLSCAFGATCKESEYVDGMTSAQCVCEISCPNPADSSEPEEPLCGSDGNTYMSECQMSLFSCRYQKLITIANRGPCKRGDPQISSDTVPTPNPVRRSTVQRTAAADHADTKSTREVIVDQPESFHLTTRPTLATPVDFGHLVNTPAFFGRSYMELPRLQAYTRLSLELEFQTFSHEGILLYNGQTTSGTGDFISLAIRDGFVEFRYNLGNGPVVLRSPHKLHLGKYHRLVAKRYLREGLLTLDGKQDVAGRSQGSLKSLDLAENLFLGYVPTERKGIFENMAVSTGMIGCIRRLKIGKREIDLRYPLSKDIIRTRNIRECGKSPCSAMPCQNNGICEPLEGNDYHCICSPRYSGKYCDTLRDPCINSSCSLGSTCVTHDVHGFICLCPPEKTGKFCEKTIEMEEVFIPDFEGESYLELPTLTNVRHAFTIEMWFLTRAPDGTLLYNGQKNTGKGDFVALTLEDGHVHFRFDLGSSVSTVSGTVNIKSEEVVTLNEWHTVKASRLWKNGTLQLNDGPLASGETATSLTELNLEQSLYIGGVPNLKTVNTESGIKTGLNGAIQRLSVNGETWEDLLAIAVWSHAIRRYRGPPCGGPNDKKQIQCLNAGVCVPRLNKATCRCPLHYMGPTCEKRVTKEDLEKPVSFDGDTFFSISNRKESTQEGQRESNIEVTFRTSSATGLLIWTHGGSSTRGGDYLALALVEGRLQLSFNLGKLAEHSLQVTSEQRLDDGKWHTAFIERNMRLGTLIVDNGTPLKNMSDPGATELNTDGIFWIGGCPNIPAGFHQGYREGFRGCIERVVIDGDPLHLVLHGSGDIAFCEGS